MSNKWIHITECPRDAMQGIHAFIPTELKINYINSLLSCGFSRLDFGSFVSPKAIPQMQDTAEVISHLQWDTPTQLLAIVANEKGVEQGLKFDKIAFLGYPFSVSEQFQQRNTNAGISESKQRLKHIAAEVQGANRHVMVYLSMGFGNPYGDPWSSHLVIDYAKELHETLGISHFALSDTIGCANPEQVKDLFQQISMELPQVEIGAHLHAVPVNAKALIASAIEAGCRYFDTALLGKGGCPMAKDELTGNLDTFTLLSFCEEQGLETQVQFPQLLACNEMAQRIFKQYH